MRSPDRPLGGGDGVALVCELGGVGLVVVCVGGVGLRKLVGDLIRDASGSASMSVAGKTQRIDVVFGANYRAAVVYAPKGRDFICFEPMAGITDAMNLAYRGLYKELQYIKPGGTWQESFWIRPSGF